MTVTYHVMMQKFFQHIISNTLYIFQKLDNKKPQPTHLDKTVNFYILNRYSPSQGPQDTPTPGFPMHEVIPLPKGKADPTVIAQIQLMLDEAKNGNLVQMAFVGLMSDGSVHECLTVGNHLYEILAALHVVEHRIVCKIEKEYTSDCCN